MNAPRIAILIPCFNAAPYLPALVENIQAQSVPFDEVICYDDGSTDDTVSVAQRLGLRIINGDGPSGPGLARNRLLRLTDCEWIHFHDADDVMAATYCEEMKSAIDERTDVLVGNVDWREEQTGALYVARHYSQRGFDGDALRYTIVKPVSVLSVTARRSKYEQINGFCEHSRCWEDGDAYVRLAARGARFKVIPRVIGISVRHTRGASRDQVYCARCRLSFLQRYARAYPRLQETIAVEVERTAAVMWGLRDYKGVKECAAVCRSLNRRFPSSGHVVLDRIMRLLPPVCAFDIQQRIRTRQWISSGRHV